jgi:hypothetical protein
MMCCAASASAQGASGEEGTRGEVVEGREGGEGSRGEGCVEDLSRDWLCPGTPAPFAGHLVPPALLVDCDRRAQLLARYRLQLGACAELRASLARAQDALQGQVYGLRVEVEQERERSRALEGRLGEALGWWDVAAWAGGGFGGGVVAALLLVLLL